MKVVAVQRKIVAVLRKAVAVHMKVVAVQMVQAAAVPEAVPRVSSVRDRRVHATCWRTQSLNKEAGKGDARVSSTAG
eukprot:1387883-Rhodomonas_salina.1